MKFTNPDTNEEIQIDFTFGLADMLALEAPDDCFHSSTEIRSRIIQGGSKQVRHQCLNCGVAIGNPLPQKDYPNSRPFDEDFLRSKQDEIDRIRWQVAQEYIAKQEKGDLEFQKEYQTYLSSPEWKKLRGLVLKRCGGICEGCMQHSAVEVHHMSYRHFREEFLFELVGLCHTCHERIHRQQDVDDSDSRPCRGCRFQGDGTICPLFDVTEVIALADSKYCGPDLSSFQALK